jgi:hypothetical protein
VPTAGLGSGVPIGIIPARAAGVARFAGTAARAIKIVVGAVGVAGGGAVSTINVATLTGIQARSPAQGVDVAEVALAA